MAAQTLTTPGTALAVIAPSRPLRGRRHLLGDAIAGLAGAVILAGAGVTMATTEALGGNPGEADNPLADAELRALCDQFCRLECDACHIINTASADEENEADRRAAPLIDEQHEIAERIAATPATTLSGLKAKAICVVMFGGAADYDADSPYVPERLLASVLGDLVGFRVENEEQASREARRQFEMGEAA